MPETSKQVIKSPYSDDYYTRVSHSSGLDILIYKAAGFKTVQASFATKYGSINNIFRCGNDAEYTEVPEGIAHFLEHKLFENEDTDVFDLFAKTGAESNAYTSFDQTCYYFTCASDWKESLRILLRFVQEPYFTAETVAKEQGIIGQEINMCNDSPDWISLFSLIKAAYKNHPLRIDIAGTIDSIAKITPELLYKCYNTFYNLHNMVLCIAGDVEVDEVLEICDNLLKPSESLCLETILPDEPYEVVEKEVVVNMPVGVPMLNFGIKCRPLSGQARFRASIEAFIALQLAFDSSTDFNARMLDSGLLTVAVGVEPFCGDGFMLLMINGETNEPYKLADEIRAEIERIKHSGFDIEHFNRIKKSLMGAKVKSMEHPDDIASSMLSAYLDGVDVFSTVPTLAAITPDDIMRCYNDLFDLSNSCISIVRNDD